MLKRLLDREDFDEVIDKMISRQEENQAIITRFEEENNSLKTCENFLRGLMRTHDKIPERTDMRPQYFMLNKDRQCCLVEEFMTEHAKKILLNMPRIKRSKALRAPMSNGLSGFVIMESPLNDFSSGHKYMLVCFYTMQWEAYKFPEKKN